MSRRAPEPLRALPCEAIDLASATLSLAVAAEDLNDGPNAQCVREAIATARNHVKRAVKAAERQPDFASLLSSVLEYAERYADLQGEPERGGCRTSIRKARSALRKLG